MRIVLHEPPHARQPRQRAARLVPMYDPELGHADRQLAVAAVARVEDEAVPRAVHRLEPPLLLLDVEREHVVLVVLPVPGRLPELRVIHVWGDDCGAGEREGDRVRAWEAGGGRRRTHPLGSLVCNIQTAWRRYVIQFKTSHN